MPAGPGRSRRTRSPAGSPDWSPTCNGHPRTGSGATYRACSPRRPRRRWSRR
jgi:hypothetical protein